MDKRSTAYLDKTRLKVICGSCGKQVAYIEEHFIAPPSKYPEEDKKPHVEGVEGPDRVVRQRFEGASARLRLTYEGRDTGIVLVVRDGEEIEVEVRDGIATFSYVQRALIIDWGYRLQPDGIWKLNARSAARLKSGKLPSVRRQQRTTNFFDAAAVFYHPNPLHKSTFDMESHSDPALKLPARLQCRWCPSVQRLEAVALQVPETSLCLGSDMIAWAKRYWSEEDFLQRYGEAGLHKPIIRRLR